MSKRNILVTVFFLAVLFAFFAAAVLSFIDATGGVL
jgi:hypothetical protein